MKANSRKRGGRKLDWKERQGYNFFSAKMALNDGGFFFHKLP